MATEVRIEPVFDALKQPLALIESDDRRQAIEAYIEAARPPLERAVHELVSQVALAVDERVSAHYRVRLAYAPGGLQVEVDEKAVGNGDDARWAAEGDVEKITIRIPAELKDLAQQAASQAGTSANTWFIKALARAVRNIEVESASGQGSRRRRPPFMPGRADDDPGGRHGRHGSRLSGWIGGDDE